MANEQEYLVEFSTIQDDGTAVRHAYSTHGCVAPGAAIGNYLVEDVFTAADATPIDGRTPAPTQPGSAVWNAFIGAGADGATLFTVLGNQASLNVAASPRRFALIDVAETEVEVRCGITFSATGFDCNAGVVLRGEVVATGGPGGDDSNGFFAIVEQFSGVDIYYLSIYSYALSVANVEAQIEFTADDLDVTAGFTLSFRDTGTELVATILEAPHITVTCADASTYITNTEVGFCGLSLSTSVTLYWDDFQAFTVLDNLSFADDRLMSPIAVSASLNIGNRLIGFADTTVGNVVLFNGDAALDDLITHAFRGQVITVKRADVGTAYASMTTVFRGRIDQPIFEHDRLILQLRRLGAEMDLPLQPATFAGTGGQEGGTDLRGKRKPLCLGYVSNIPLVLVDDSNGSGRPEYWVHDGAVQSVDAVYFSGVLKAAGVDYNVLTAGGVTTIELLAAPLGQVTADVSGDVTDAVYATSAPDIIDLLAREYMGYTDSQIDTAAFTAAATDAPYGCGLYTGTEDITRREAIGRLAESVNAAVYINRLDQITIKVLDNPGVSASKTLDDSTIQSVKTLAKPSALKAVRWGYSRNYRIQGESDLASSVTNARKQYLAEEYRVFESTDPTVIRREPYAEEFRIDSLLYASPGASAVSAAVLALHDPEKMLYSIDARHSDNDIDLGDTLEIEWSRFGMSAGKNLLVVGVTESASADAYTVTGWG